jgi:hypothetical protein
MAAATSAGPMSVADLINEARTISARENAKDRRLRENQGAWSGNSVFGLETPFATRHGKLLPQETLRVKTLLTGRPHFDGTFSSESYPNARGSSPRVPPGRETRLYVVRLIETKFLVGSFQVGRDETDLSGLDARLEAHRSGDCQWTKRYPPVEGHDAVYWFQRESNIAYQRRVDRSNEDRESIDDVSRRLPIFAEDALVERLMFEKHERHGLDVVRGGSCTSAELQDHRKRALTEAFFIKTGPVCPVCMGPHVSKRCAARREATRAYREWCRRDDDDGVCPDADVLETSSERSSEERAFARETAAFSLSSIARSKSTATVTSTVDTPRRSAGRSAGPADVGGLPKKWTEAEESDLLRALHAGFAGPSEIGTLARERGRTEQDVLSRIKLLWKRV